MIKIGISSCFFHPDPQRPVFKGKTLLYIEQSSALWVNSENALAFMIPPVNPGSQIRLESLVREMDGLILHGGADVSPKSYGETPIQPEWSGDFIRDRYEIELLQAFMDQRKPVLGVCRGAQLLNVALGGTLYQDIATQIPGALNHRNWEVYDQNSHSVEFAPGSRLQGLYSNSKTDKINSIHHQAIKDLGKGLIVEARSPKDGIIEAIRLESELYVSAVQWHPEFHDPHDPSWLSSRPLLQDFLGEVRKRKENPVC